ncbi:ATP-binding protein [Kribbella sp. NPDC004536]|uniref:ATP-binding protein n=1 Tax=Kribbella sp. NPDC004536 TaxID=3364106 RepID=UPI0036AD4D4F
MQWPLVEREFELGEVAAAVADAATGDGAIVLLAGEAGIGKSSIIRALPAALPGRHRMLVGQCDDLTPPRVLGPFRDIGAKLGPSFAAALLAEDRSRVIDSLLAELSASKQPTILVVEDMHWADEATTDVVSYLIRRIDQLPAVLILSYRDDHHLGYDHRLRNVLALTARCQRHRLLRPSPLSLTAVRRLSLPSGLDPDEVFAVTSGNPLFVSEVVASGDVDSVPPTIAAATMVGMSGLSANTRASLERLSVVPSGLERWLAEAALDGDLSPLAMAEQHGLMTVSPQHVAFRHELMRRAVLDSLVAVQRIAYNQKILAALLHAPSDVDVSRILHHAAEAGDNAVIVEYGPLAARKAAAAGSHREAAVHYRLVLEHREVFSPAEQVVLLERYATECYTVGLAKLAAQQQEEVVRLRRQLHDTLALGTSLRLLSRLEWWAGHQADAHVAIAEAIAVLKIVGDDVELAYALSYSSLYSSADDPDGAIEVGRSAVSMAQSTGVAAVTSVALYNAGVTLWYLGRSGGQALLEESLKVALDAHEIEHACRADLALVWMFADDLHYAEAERRLDAAIEMARDGELDGFRRQMHLHRSIIDLARGAWDSAEREAELAATAQSTTRSGALAILAQLRQRRGQDSSALLASAWSGASELGPPVLAPVAIATLEASWLTGEPAPYSFVALYEEVRKFGSKSQTAELGYWARANGLPIQPYRSDHPYDLLADGKWQQAAKIWRAAGCPYEEALALSQSSDPEDLLAALSILDALGGRPLARRIRQRLRELGVQRVPRGPTAATLSNPGGLSRRQAEVVHLLAEGLTNAEIATRMVLSVRTVETHVAAIMEKLGASTRAEAVARAEALGLVAIVLPADPAE